MKVAVLILRRQLETVLIRLTNLRQTVRSCFPSLFISARFTRIYTCLQLLKVAQNWRKEVETKISGQHLGIELAISLTVGHALPTVLILALSLSNLLSNTWSAASEQDGLVWVLAQVSRNLGSRAQYTVPSALFSKPFYQLRRQRRLANAEEEIKFYLQ